MQRSPIRRRALWVALISLIGQFSSALWGDAVSLELQNALESALDLALLAGLVISAEKVVTPVDDPRDDAGQQLIPAAQPDPIV